MVKPIIDILVPTYEPAPEFLRLALDSIRTQTETRWRCFINDDASDTDVKSVVAPYLKDSRFSFCRNEKSLGIGGNWNTCLERLLHSSSIYIQFLFQDDSWHVEYLQKMIAVLGTYPDVGFASADHTYVCEQGIEIAKGYDVLRAFKNKNIAPGMHNGKELFKWWITHDLHPNIIGEPSFVMLRKNIIKKSGLFADDMPQFLDVDYWVRTLEHANWYNIPENLGIFRVHAKGASMKNNESGKGVFDRFYCIERLIERLPKGLFRDEACIMRKRALKHMCWKFFDRMYNRKNISMQGSGSLKRFCLRHPLLIGKVTGQVIWEKLKKESKSKRSMPMQKR